MRWQIHEAQQRFGEVVQRALREGPQVITQEGEESVVVIAAGEYHRWTKNKPDFKAFLLNAPDFDALEIRRPDQTARRIELEDDPLPAR